MKPPTGVEFVCTLVVGQGYVQTMKLIRALCVHPMTTTSSPIAVSASVQDLLLKANGCGILTDTMWNLVNLQLPCEDFEAASTRAAYEVSRIYSSAKETHTHAHTHTRETHTLT